MDRLKQILLVILMFGFSFGQTFAQKSKKKRGKKKASEVAAQAKPKAKKPKAAFKKLEEVVKKMTKSDGLFTIYRDTLTGKAYLNVKASQLGQSFIYFSVARDGAPWFGNFRGRYRENYVFKIERYFDRLRIVQVNTAYYFDPQNALSRAAEANLPPTILFDEKIHAKDSSDNYLIKADGLFLTEALDQVKPSRPRKPNPNRPTLGGLNRSKSRYVAIKNYPQNTDVVVEYVYTKGSNSATFYHPSVPDQRSISIHIQHSLIALPENDFEPRYDDPRVGYFTDQITDLTATNSTPYRDLIHRWHLKKKDPNATLSEPVEPITWWIENTTPVEFREVIKQGVLEWNKAFEKAGFKNALVVKVQPDSADWDAGDIRYNVLRWTSSPVPPFGGYGPSFVNPLTGQILGADIMLEFVHFTNRVKYEQLYETQTQSILEELTEGEPPFDFEKRSPHFCNYNAMLQKDWMFGSLNGFQNGDFDLDGLKKEAMLELIMHEVGHTLGLNHNMKASQLYSPAELNDSKNLKSQTLTGSVMDYVVINVNKDRSKQGLYYSATVGPYDVWAIEYGYKPTDAAGLKTILDRSTEPELTFGNDADDMRAPGLGIDPRIMIGDLSNDVVAYAADRLELVATMFKGLKDQYNKAGQSYHDLLTAFIILSSQQRQAARTISRYIGGIYLDRAFIGQPGATKPFEPVPYEKQKAAMQALAKYVFGVEALKAPQDLYNYLQRQRRGFNHYGNPEDPRIHSQVLGIQKDILRHLLNHQTLRKISDSEVYGNTYDLAEYMTELNGAIFNADISGNVNSFRRNLQVEYVKYLTGIYDSKSPFTNHAKTMAYYNLTKIQQMVSAVSGNLASRAHKLYLKKMIKDAFDK